MKVYVEAQSKAALIRRLAAGEEISGYNYSMFGGGGHYMLDDTLEDGTIIAIYSQMSGGNPVAKSWGTWTNGVLKAETFESPVSCKICGKTFDSFRGLNGHMNAHIPSHRKRAETYEAESFSAENPKKAKPTFILVTFEVFDGNNEYTLHHIISQTEYDMTDEGDLIKDFFGEADYDGSMYWIDSERAASIVAAQPITLHTRKLLNKLGFYAESFEAISDDYSISMKRSNPLSRHYIPTKKKSAEGRRWKLCDICLKGEYFCNCWVCDHCETSNAIDNDLCSICGTSQLKSVSIQAWPMYVKWESAGGVYELIENGAYGSIFPEWPILYLHLDEAQKNAYKPNDNDFATAEKAWELYHNLYTPEGIPVLNPRSSTVRLNPSGKSAESFKDWADSELGTHGKDVTFNKWVQEEYEDEPAHRHPDGQLSFIKWSNDEMREKHHNAESFGVEGSFEHECVTCMEGMDELVAQGQIWSCECCGLMVGTEGDHEYCGQNDEGTVGCAFCIIGEHEVQLMYGKDSDRFIINSTCRGWDNQKHIGKMEYEVGDRYVFGAESDKLPYYKDRQGGPFWEDGIFIFNHPYDDTAECSVEGEWEDHEWELEAQPKKPGHINKVGWAHSMGIQTYNMVCQICRLHEGDFMAYRMTPKCESCNSMNLKKSYDDEAESDFETIITTCLDCGTTKTESHEAEEESMWTDSSGREFPFSTLCKTCQKPEHQDGMGEECPITEETTGCPCCDQKAELIAIRDYERDTVHMGVPPMSYEQEMAGPPPSEVWSDWGE